MPRFKEPKRSHHAGSKVAPAATKMEAKVDTPGIKAEPKEKPTEGNPIVGLGQAGNITEQIDQVLSVVFASRTTINRVLEEVKEQTAHTQGYQEGYKAGYGDGIRHLITLAEANLARSLGIFGREELVHSGKIPSWWMITLVQCHTDKEFEEAPYQVVVLPQLTPTAIIEVNKYLQEREAQLKEAKEARRQGAIAGKVGYEKAKAEMAEGFEDD